MHQRPQLCPKDWLGYGDNPLLTLYLFGCIGRVSLLPVPNYKLLICDRQNLHRSAQFSKLADVGIGCFARYPIRLMITICPLLLGNIGHILPRILLRSWIRLMRLLATTLITSSLMITRLSASGSFTVTGGGRSIVCRTPVLIFCATRYASFKTLCWT